MSADLLLTLDVAAIVSGDWLSSVWPSHLTGLCALTDVIKLSSSSYGGGVLLLKFRGNCSHGKVKLSINQ